MNLSRWRVGVVLCCTVGLSALACSDQRSEEIGRHARAWVDRQHDSTATQDSTLVMADSLRTDSVTADWTTDDWLYFWHEVEKEQARRKQTDST
jgi:hypothetical protein